jgi:predicted Zn finger-like uncharacterized protein
MAVKFECPECKKKYRAKDDYAGRVVQCKNCGNQITVPRPQPPETEEQSPQQEEIPRQMRANQALSGQGCAICQENIEFGDPVRNCEVCGAVQHQSCWDSAGGCGTDGCDNAPLPELDLAEEQPPPPPAQAGSGTMQRKPCPYCGESIALAAIKCRHCGEFLEGASPSQTPAGGGTSQKAIWALVCGLVGLLCFGIILGPVALGLGSSAKKDIRNSNGRLGGSGMATAGIVLGIVDIIGFLVVILMGIASS